MTTAPHHLPSPPPTALPQHKQDEPASDFVRHSAALKAIPDWMERRDQATHFVTLAFNDQVSAEVALAKAAKFFQRATRKLLSNRRYLKYGDMWPIVLYAVEHVLTNTHVHAIVELDPLHQDRFERFEEGAEKIWTHHDMAPKGTVSVERIRPGTTWDATDYSVKELRKRLLEGGYAEWHVWKWDPDRAPSSAARRAS
jgi:hypothetical protein